MKKCAVAAVAVTVTAIGACGGSGVTQFVRTSDPIIVLRHIRIIDGTGGPGRDDQSLVIADRRILAVGDAGRVPVPSNARVLDLPGRTVFPGLVGMHEHLFYQYQPPASEPVAILAQAPFATLYLASGVTTIRTAGTLDLGGDLRIKRLIDEGREPGPKIHVTGPYLNASSRDPDPEGIAREVAAQADEGATSFKAYTSLRASELRAAIGAAHDRGLRITGHLCAVGFREAAALGIDNVEHGLPFDTDLYSGKQPDVCPDQWAVFGELLRMDVTDVSIRQAISDLVRHGVALTSTLAVIESFTAREAAFDPRTPTVLAARLQDPYRAANEARMDASNRGSQMWSGILHTEMAFERAFVAAGGRLMAGVDPTGWGGVVAGFGDQRELELLVEAGLTPEQAIKVATANGAAFLYEQDAIGSVAVGKQADLVVVRGNPSVRIADVRNVELVFKDGVAYDPATLIAAAQGTVGQFDVWRMFRSPLDLFMMCVVGLLLACVVWKRTRSRRAAHASPLTVPEIIPSKS